MDEFFGFDDDELISRILREHERPMLNTINDTEIKEIGDRVEVLDYSSVCFSDGQELEDSDYDYIVTTEDLYYIVIDVRLNNKHKSYNQDIIMVNPKTNQQFRALSRHLKIYRRF